ncbi:hypothetical protein CYLTODRAFT_491771 [Cylindrobasidium torrendii FP15055 ss-10]|uniref:Uncharacterized protein n=1 Tax=Cylindrobasidium torrendii FP15055 ss-10 TaxID=1314674 RepID=A0A0D7B7C8_9AGAR|nr:hypothetical protein CYLTODRAFT_491771 [Cylindrobasidium torrendii FP15055 ss-10]
MEKPFVAKFKPNKTPEVWVPKDYPDYTSGQTGPDVTRQHRQECQRRQEASANYAHYPGQPSNHPAFTFMAAPHPSIPTTSTSTPTSTSAMQITFESYDPTVVQTSSSRRPRAPAQPRKKKTAPKAADAATKPLNTRKRARAEKDFAGGPTNRQRTMDRTQTGLPAGVTKVTIKFDKAAHEGFGHSNNPYGTVSVFVTVDGDDNGHWEATLTFGDGVKTLLRMSPPNFVGLPENEFVVFAEGTDLCPDKILHLRVPHEKSKIASKPKVHRFVKTMSFRVASAAEASAVFKAALAKHRGLKVGVDTQVASLETSSQPLKSLTDVQPEGVVDDIPDPSGPSSLTDATATEPHSVTEGAGDSVVVPDDVQGAAQESHLAEVNPHPHRGSDDGHATDYASPMTSSVTSPTSEVDSGSSSIPWSQSHRNLGSFLGEAHEALDTLLGENHFDESIFDFDAYSQDLPTPDEQWQQTQHDPDPYGLLANPAALAMPFY